MTIFNFLFSPQDHKNRRGYFINHDTLLALDTPQRKRLIAYFIAQQTPQKLSQEDYQKYTFQKIAKLQVNAVNWGVVFALFGLLSRPLTTQRSYYILRNSLSYLTKAVLFSTLGYTIAYGSLQGRFVSDSKQISNIVNNYNFSVYDFALAKKQSKLKVLRSQMTATTQLKVI